MSNEDPLLGLRTILIVDDNAKTGRQVARMLARAGQYIHTEVSGREAVAWFSRHADHVDLVIVDQIMPELSGVEVAEQLWALRPDLPIFLMSALENDEIEPILKGRPFLGFLKKPFKSWELHLRVQSVLGV